jgi:O-antigen/teichoic acid export membrane protein
LGTLKSEQLLAHNFIVATGTIVAGLLGVAFQSIVSHQLSPTDFGGVFAIITIITFIGMPASSVMLLMARETSRGRASGHEATSAALLRRGNRSLLLLGLMLAAAFSLGSRALSDLFAVPVELWLAAAIGLPFTLALPLLLGELQGEERFIAFVSLLAGQAALKLVGAIVLGAVFGSLGVVAGISVATIFLYLITLRLLRRKFRIRPNLEWWRPAVSYLATVAPSALAVAVLLSADVLIVKHYFPPGQAGQYSAVAAIGRAVFWGASGVAIVLFPKLTYRIETGRGGLQLVGASLLLVAIGGLVGFGFLSASSVWLMGAFSGGAYSAGGAYLPLYAFGMMMLGGVAVLVAALQSRGKPGFLAVLLPLTAIEPTLIASFHATLTQVVLVVDLSMLAVLAGLGALFIVQERASSMNQVVLSAETPLTINTQLQGNQ